MLFGGGGDRMRAWGGLDVHDDEEDLQTLEVAPPHGPGSVQTPEPPADRRPRNAGPAVAALVVMMLIAGVVGFAVTKQVRSGKDFNRAVAGQPAADDPDESALGDLNVQQTDVSARYRVDLIRNGASVTGATLDLCNATFPSERLRTARRQVAAYDTIGSLALSTEAVLYRRPADAAEAFTELHTLERTCPDRPVPSPTGGSTVTTHFGGGARPVMEAVRKRRADRVRREHHRRHRRARSLGRGVPAPRSRASWVCTSAPRRPRSRWSRAKRRSPASRGSSRHAWQSSPRPSSTAREEGRDLGTLLEHWPRG